MIESPHPQGSYEWHCARAGMITGTSLHRAVDTPAKRKTFTYELVASLMTDPVIMDINTPAVIRGNEYEPMAVAAVAAETGLRPESRGFLISEVVDMFGLSPDAVVCDKKGKIVGGFETKCPNSATHVKYMLEDILPPQYKYQVYAPFVADDDVEFWVFGSYDDRCYGKELFLHHVDREDILEEVLQIREKLAEFVSKVKGIHETLIF